MNHPKYSLLIDKKNATIEGNKKAIEAMTDVKDLFSLETETINNIEYSTNSGFDEIFKVITEAIGEADGYHIAGEMINQLMLSFPKLKYAWSDLSDDQKWIFIEAIHYGIRSKINEHLGYTQRG